jgi:hypothetical protein
VAGTAQALARAEADPTLATSAHRAGHGNAVCSSIEVEVAVGAVHRDVQRVGHHAHPLGDRGERVPRVVLAPRPLTDALQVLVDRRRLDWTLRCARAATARKDRLAAACGR